MLKRALLVLITALLTISTYSMEYYSQVKAVNLVPSSNLQPQKSIEQEAIDESIKVLEQIITFCGESEFITVGYDPYLLTNGLGGIIEFKNVRRKVKPQPITSADRANNPGIEWKGSVTYEPEIFRIFDSTNKRWSQFFDTALSQIGNLTNGNIVALNIDLQKLNGRWRTTIKFTATKKQPCDYYNNLGLSQPNNPRSDNSRSNPTSPKPSTSPYKPIDSGLLMSILRDIAKNNNLVKECLSKYRTDRERLAIFAAGAVDLNGDSRNEVVIDVMRSNDSCGLCDNQGCPKWVYSTRLLGIDPILEVKGNTIAPIEITSNGYKDLRLTFVGALNRNPEIYKFNGKVYVKSDTASNQELPQRKNKNLWVYNADPTRSTQSKTYKELSNFIVAMTKIRVNDTKPTYRYTISILGVTDTLQTNEGLETASLEAVIDRDMFVILDSYRTLRNPNRGGIGIYRNIINDFNNPGNDPGWEELSVAQAAFDGQELAYNRISEFFSLFLGIGAERSTPKLAKFKTSVEVADYTTKLINDLLSLNNNSPSIIPSSEYANKVRDVNNYKVINFAATKLKSDLPLLSGLVYGVRFEIVLDESKGAQPNFFLRARNKNNDVIGIEIGSDASNPKIYSGKLGSK